MKDKITESIMKLFAKQILDFDEQTKSMIEQDILEARKKVSLISESIEHGLGSDGLYRRVATINIRTYHRKLVAELTKQEKPYLQFLQSYSPILSNQ